MDAQDTNTKPNTAAKEDRSIARFYPHAVCLDNAVAITCEARHAKIDRITGQATRNTFGRTIAGAGRFIARLYRSATARSVLPRSLPTPYGDRDTHHRNTHDGDDRKYGLPPLWSEGA